MTADIIPVLPSSVSPRIPRGVTHGDALKPFAISPCANAHFTCYGSFFEKAQPNMSHHDLIEAPSDLEQSWEDISPRDKDLRDEHTDTLSDWAIVTKPLLLSESQYPNESLRNKEPGFERSLVSPVNEEGFVVSEPLNLPTSTQSCTTMVVYQPNPIQGFLCSPKVCSRSSSWRGMHNLGNTCYLNASLQTLSNLDGFVQDIIAATSEKSDRPGSHSERKLLNELAHVFSRLRGDEILEDGWTIMSDDKSGVAVDPTALKEIIDEKSPLFVGFQQHDSHEFITTFLDLLHDELKQTESDQRVESHESVGCDISNVCDDSTNYVIVQDSPKKARLNAEDGSVTLEEDVDHARSQDTCTQRALSLSALSMEGIEELLTNPSSISIPSRPEALDIQENNSSWKPFWKSKSHKGYLFGGRSSFTPSTTSSQRFTRYKDPSWQRIGNDLLQEKFSTVNENQSSNNSSLNRLTFIPSQCSVETSKDASLIDSYFTTEIRNHLECNSCKFTRSQIETFRCLSLELVDSESSISELNYTQTVQESLRKFFSPEKREIKCEKCFFDSATRTMEITKLPRALILHLKRFILDINPDFMSMTCKKNHSPVQFSTHLSLNPMDDEGVLAEYLASDVRLPHGVARNACHGGTPRYGLRSIIHHLGSSSEFGHYTATLNRSQSERLAMQSNRHASWINCNDNFVSDCTEAEVVSDASSQASAYLFIYDLEVQ